MKAHANGFSTPFIMLSCLLLLLLATTAVRELSLCAIHLGDFFKGLRHVTSQLRSDLLSEQSSTTFRRAGSVEFLEATQSALLLPYVDKVFVNPVHCTIETIHTNPAFSCYHHELSHGSVAALTDCRTTALTLLDKSALISNLCTDSVKLKGQITTVGYVELVSDLIVQSDSIISAAGDISIARIQANGHRLTLLSASGKIQVAMITGAVQLRASAPKGVAVPANALSQSVPLLPSLLGREVLALYPE